MAFRLPSRRTWALSIATLIAAYLLLAWLALPRILQFEAEKFIVEKTGHHLTMERPEFNPFKSRLRLSGVHLEQPDGTPLLTLRELVVEMSGTSLFRRALVFDDISLDGLEVTVAVLPQGRLNWSALLDALKSKEPTPSDAAPPRLDIRHFMLSGARLNFSDKRETPAFTTRIEPLNLELSDVSTLPDDEGSYKISAQTAFGARIEWHGKIDLEPLAMTGNLSIANADIAKLAGYVEDRLPVVLPAGIASMSADYRLGQVGGKPDLNLEHVAVKLSGLKLRGRHESGPAISIGAIEAKDGGFNLLKNSAKLGVLTVSNGSVDLRQDRADAPKALQLGNLSFEDVRVNLSSHEATISRIALKDGNVRLTHNAAGRMDVLDVLQSLSPTEPAAVPHKQKDKESVREKTESAAGQSSWHYRVKKLELADCGVTLRDESVAPAAEFSLVDIAIGAEGISDDWKAAVPITASFKVKSGGSFTASGTVVPATPSAEFQLKLGGLSLSPAQPYLSAATHLKLSGGKVSSAGRAHYSPKSAGYRGSFELADLRLTEEGTNAPFLALKSLGSRAFEVMPEKLSMDELAIVGLDTKLTIEKDKSVSVKRILKSAPDEAAKPAGAAPRSAVAATKPMGAAPKPAQPQSAPVPAFLVSIDRLRVSQSDLDFADYSLAFPFATHIHDLQGVITGISSRPDAPSQIELDGQVDEYGQARAAGQVEMFNPTNLMDIRVVFRNIEMYRLTPYSATFVGRKITSGRLSLDLEYKIHQRQLEGENKVVMDKLTLGEKVESPDAMSLPLDLAIAILQDADGHIDLGLPVSGSLDDPQFSYGRIVWKAIVNVLTKIVTAPFRALGALFGGGEKVENIAFDAGRAALAPPEREKMVKIATALNKRPGLALTLHGVYAEADRPALQEKQLRRSVAEKIGQQVEEGSDPGPIATHQPKVRAALEELYAQHLGSGNLAALKDGFRKANPGQMEESLKEKLSGLLRAKKPLSEQEAAGLKGGDFYLILAERLRSSIAIDEARLQSLASARAAALSAILQAAGAPMERIAMGAAQKVEAQGDDVPVKLELGAAQKTKPAASAVPAANN